MGDFKSRKSLMMECSKEFNILTRVVYEFGTGFSMTMVVTL